MSQDRTFPEEPLADVPTSNRLKISCVYCMHIGIATLIISSINYANLILILMLYYCTSLTSEIIMSLEPAK